MTAGKCAPPRFWARTSLMSEPGSVASEESVASPEYKTMLLESEASDLVYTDRMSGMAAIF